MPESLLHFELRQLLWQLLSRHFGHLGTAGSDQFVYWDATDPAKNLAPDVYFALGEHARPITSWKTWERGVPEVAFEIVSDVDSSSRAREKSVDRYAQLGVRELFRFDRRGGRMVFEAWDIANGVATPRSVSADLTSPCLTLGCVIAIRPVAPLGLAMRLARDLAGSDLFPTERELSERVSDELVHERAKRQRETEKRKREAEKRKRAEEARAREAAERQRAEARVAELLAQLAEKERSNELG